MRASHSASRPPASIAYHRAPPASVNAPRPHTPFVGCHEQGPVAHMGDCIRICAARDELTDDVGVAVEGCPEQRRPALMLRQVDICAARQQGVDDLPLTLEDGMEQRTKAFPVPPGYRCTFIQATQHARHVSTADGTKQRTLIAHRRHSVAPRSVPSKSHWPCDDGEIIGQESSWSLLQSLSGFSNALMGVPNA